MSAGDVHKTSVGGVLRKLHWDVLRTSVVDVPWYYIENYMGTSIG